LPGGDPLPNPDLNLGHTQFYPGANVAVNHAHNSIRLY